MEGALVLLLALVVAAAVAVAGRRAQQRRSEQLLLLTTARGWGYARRDDSLLGLLRADFPLFRAGTGGRRCENVVYATTPAGAPCTMFDYRYQVRGRSGGKATTSRTVRHAVAFTRLPAWLPELRVAPETLASRVASAVGFRDVEVESDEFNRRFRVTAASRSHAFDVLHPRCIEFLLGQRYQTWEIAGDRLVVTARGRWEEGDHDRVLAAVEEFVALVPGYVWSRRGLGRETR